MTLRYKWLLFFFFFDRQLLIILKRGIQLLHPIFITERVPSFCQVEYRCYSLMTHWHREQQVPL